MDVDANFGEKAYGYELISTETNRRKRLDEIAESISGYGNDKAAWNETLTGRHH
jgi:hypothetical protein